MRKLALGILPIAAACGAWLACRAFVSPPVPTRRTNAIAAAERHTPSATSLRREGDDFPVDPGLRTGEAELRAPAGKAGTPGLARGRIFELHTDPEWTAIDIGTARVTTAEGHSLGTCRPGQRIELAGPGPYTANSPSPGWRIEPEEFDCPPDGPTDCVVDAWLAPQNRYRGRVVDGANGRPLEALEVTVAYRELGTPGEHYRPLGAGHCPAGEFHFAGAPIAEGEICFSFEATGYLGARTDWLPCRPGAAIEDLVVALEPDDAPSGRVALRVRGPVGPLAGARVTLVRIDDPAPVSLALGGSPIERLRIDDTGAHPVSYGALESNTPPRFGATDRHGTFASDVRPGEYQTIVQASGHAAALSTAFHVPPGARLERDVALELGSVVTGALRLAAADEREPRELEVGIHGEDRDAFLRPRDDGTFRVPALAPGPYWIEIRAGRDVIAGRAFTVVAGEDLYLEIRCGRLADGATVEGTLSQDLLAAGTHSGTDGGDWNWLVGAIPDVETPTASAVRTATPDGAGHFRIHGLPHGAWLLCAAGWTGDEGPSRARVRRVALRRFEVTEPQGLVKAIELTTTGNRLTVERAWTPYPGPIDLKLRPLDASPAAAMFLSDLGHLTGLEPGEQRSVEGLPGGTFRLEGPGVDLSLEGAGETTLTVD